MTTTWHQLTTWINLCRNSTEYQRERAAYMARQTCRLCAKFNAVSKATDLDHVIPILLYVQHASTAQEVKEKFFEKKNWQPLCFRCHRLKTTEDRVAIARAKRGGTDHRTLPCGQKSFWKRKSARPEMTIDRDGNLVPHQVNTKSIIELYGAYTTPKRRPTWAIKELNAKKGT